MRVSSAQEDDWSIISSSSDLDEDLSASLLQGEGSSNDQNEDLDHNGDYGAYGNGSGDATDVAEAKAEESNQDSSTHTITPRTNSFEQKQIRNRLKSGTLASDQKTDKAIRDYPCGYSAARFLCKGTSEVQPFAARVSSGVGCVSRKFDRCVRWLSATGFDWSLGLLLAGLQHVRETSKSTGLNNPQICNKRCNKFLAPCLNTSILALEVLKFVREIWLYQLILVLTGVFAFRQVHSKPVAKKLYFSSFMEHLGGGKSWQDVYDATFYEDGPVSRNFFGFTTVGPRQLRAARYWEVIREKSKPFMTSLQEKIWQFQEVATPYLAIVGGQTSKLGQMLIAPKTWSTINSFTAKKVAQMSSVFVGVPSYCKQYSQAIADLTIGTCGIAYERGITGYEHIAMQVRKTFQYKFPPFEDLYEAFDAKFTKLAIAANNQCKSVVVEIFSSLAKLAKRD